MGSFSWNRADEVDVSDVENIVYGRPFKFLIPKEFGGGFIIDKYQDYGCLGINEDRNEKHDMYELLAFWNRPDLVKYNGDFNPMKEIDEHTDHNRGIGINIGCGSDEIDKLKYPLKLVSVDFEGTYEDINKPSYGDPDQGFGPRFKE